MSQPKINSQKYTDDEYIAPNEYEDNLIEDDDSFEENGGLPNFGGDDVPSKPMVNTTHDSEERYSREIHKTPVPKKKAEPVKKHQQNLVSFGDSSNFHDPSSRSPRQNNHSSVQHIRESKNSDSYMANSRVVQNSSPMEKHNISADYALSSGKKNNNTTSTNAEKGYDIQSTQQYKRKIKAVASSGKTVKSAHLTQSEPKSTSSSTTDNPTNESNLIKRTFLPKIPEQNQQSKKASSIQPVRRSRQLSDDNRNIIDSSKNLGYSYEKETRSVEKYTTPRRGTNPVNSHPVSNQVSCGDGFEESEVRSMGDNPKHVHFITQPKIRKIASDNYYAEKVAYVMNQDQRKWGEKDIAAQNLILRKLVVEVKDEIKRMLSRASGGETSMSTKRNGPSIKLNEILEDIKFNDEVIAAQMEEVGRLSRALDKASNVEYMADMEEKTRKIRQEIKLAERERRNLDFLQKKELYTPTSTYYYGGMDQATHKKVSTISDKREQYDRLKRQLFTVQNRNQQADEFINEQTEHLRDLNEKHKKLVTIADHQGLLSSNQKKREKMANEEMKKKYQELKRACEVTERSINNKLKQFENEAELIRKEINKEKAIMNEQYLILDQRNALAEDLKFQIQEYNNMSYNNLYDPSMGDLILKLEEDSRNSESRLQVTPNEFSLSNLHHHQSFVLADQIAPMNHEKEKKVKPKMSFGEFDTVDNHRPEYNHPESEDKTPDLTTNRETGQRTRRTDDSGPKFFNVNQADKVLTDSKPTFSSSELLRKKKTLDENDLADERKNKKVYDAYTFDDEDFSSKEHIKKPVLRHSIMAPPTHLFENRLSADVGDDDGDEGYPSSNMSPSLNPLTSGLNPDSGSKKGSYRHSFIDPRFIENKMSIGPPGAKKDGIFERNKYKLHLDSERINMSQEIPKGGLNDPKGIVESSNETSQTSSQTTTQRKDGKASEPQSQSQLSNQQSPPQNTKDENHVPEIREPTLQERVLGNPTLVMPRKEKEFIPQTQETKDTQKNASSSKPFKMNLPSEDKSDSSGKNYKIPDKDIPQYFENDSSNSNTTSNQSPRGPNKNLSQPQSQTNIQNPESNRLTLPKQNNSSPEKSDPQGLKLNSFSNNSPKNKSSQNTSASKLSPKDKPSATDLRLNNPSPREKSLAQNPSGLILANNSTFKIDEEEIPGSQSNKNSRIRRRPHKVEEATDTYLGLKPSHPGSKRDLTKNVDPFANFEDVNNIDFASKGKKLFGESKETENTANSTHDLTKSQFPGSSDSKPKLPEANVPLTTNKENGMKIIGISGIVSTGGSKKGLMDDDDPRPQEISNPSTGRRMKMNDPAASKAKKQETDQNKEKMLANKAEREGNDFFSNFDSITN